MRFGCCDCFMPPHILSRMVLSNHPLITAKLRASLMSTLNTSHSLITQRVGFDESARIERQARRLNRLLSTRRSLRRALIAAGPDRIIRSANNRQTTLGRPVRREGDAPVSASNVNPEYAQAINEAYDGMGQVYDFYWQLFDRDSIDDAGMELKGIVHYGESYDNAFWNGQQMIFGDGDRVTFNRFTLAVDVIGHEMTHGVTQHEAGLIYWAETGALNESVSDVFGTMIKQYVLGQSADQADWLIGEKLLIPLPSSPPAPGAVRVAIRSMAAPGTAFVNDPVLGSDPQPAHMNDYVHTVEDNGGVHINSGIPNHAFYLAATALGGNSWETVGPTWYQTLKSPALAKTATFQEFAALSVKTASVLDPTGNVADAITTAWSQVGIST